MTTRQFDPVFSAALRNELEAIADGQQEAPRPARRPARTLLARPQLWVSLVTALVLAVTTIGVLRLTHAAQPAEPVRTIDPMSQITNPADSDYVAREVRVVTTLRGTGTGTTDFDVPASVASIRVYVDCSPDGHYSLAIDSDGESSGGCSRTIGSYFDTPIKAGLHTITAKVGASTRFSVLVIATPSPTIASGGLIDPLAQVRDLRNPDALTGNTAPVLSATGVDGPGTVSTPNHPAQRLRAYFVCATGSATAEAVVDGHTMRGCMNSIAHWFDFTPRPGTLSASFTPTGESSLLIVRAPAGAKDSPASATLAYPEAGGGTVLGRGRGTGAPASGTYLQVTDSVLMTSTCRGTGWLEIHLGDGSGTNTRGQACSTKDPAQVGFGGGKASKKPLRWTVIPHGDISWTFQLTTDA